MASNIGNSVLKTNSKMILPNLRRLVLQKHDKVLFRPSWDIGKVERRHYCQNAEDPGGDFRKIDVAKVRTTTGTFHIDTLEMSKLLSAEGFTPRQSEVLTKILGDVVTAALDHQAKVMVTKPQQEIMVQQLLSQINSVKKDMVILEKSEFTMIKNDTDKQQIIIKNLESKLDDEIKKLKGTVLLDVNLERGRASEAHAANERKVLSLEHKIEVEHANTATTLKELEKKIDLGISATQTDHEKFKVNFASGIAGTVLTILGIVIACARFFVSTDKSSKSEPKHTETSITK